MRPTDPYVCIIVPSLTLTPRFSYACRAIPCTPRGHTVLQRPAAHDLHAAIPHVGAIPHAGRASTAAQRSVLETAQADAALRAEDPSRPDSLGWLKHAQSNIKIIHLSIHRKFLERMSNEPIIAETRFDVM